MDALYKSTYTLPGYTGIMAIKDFISVDFFQLFVVSCAFVCYI